ncbi:MAG: ChaN family lipoprotein [Bacteroidales bacterium]
MKLSIPLLLLTFTTGLYSQDKPAYRIFTGEGKPAGYYEMVKTLSGADIVLFGELHDDPVSHWLELEITRSLKEVKNENMIMGAEMFEADNQLLVDEYMSGSYDAGKFEEEVKLWKNYKTDYKPLVEFAKTNQIRFVATNVPRRYAAIVARKGFEGLDSLTPQAKKYIAPIPFPYDSELKCYKDMLKMDNIGDEMRALASVNLPRAQALKDATMAHFILENYRKGILFIHYNGAYHSRNYEGIVWYLKKSDPSLKILTVETVRQKETETPEKENLNVATFVIVIPESMTRTY